ncbi:MAG: galactonate dehydratase [SAR202 cluster bacterium]|nr:galactonate dehydratase [SAR202 cluster bacterium]
MKITAIKPYVMWGETSRPAKASAAPGGRNWMFVKVETDAGIYGWGEGSLVNEEPTIAQCVEQLAPQIMGDDAHNIERIWQKLWLHNRYRGGVIIMSAISAIDQALWDIKGKALGVPVYQLLGGAVRDRIRVYSHASSPEEAKKRVQEGFNAIKAGTWHKDMDRGIVESVLPGWLADHVTGLREAVGPDVDIMLDNHGRSRPALAIKQVRAIDHLNVLFFEEPTPPENQDALKLIRQAGLQTEIATGERLLTRWGYREVIEQQLVDIVQPDICHCGGISEMRRIAAMAEVYHINMAFHNPKGPVATAASIHISAAIPNFLILEHSKPNSVFEELQVAPIKMEGGYYGLPTAPGLGVDLREDVIASRPYQYRHVIYSYMADGTPAQP